MDWNGFRANVLKFRFFKILNHTMNLRWIKLDFNIIELKHFKNLKFKNPLKTKIVQNQFKNLI